jgi:tetratricopeptide (TPR) repeat protein
MSLFPSVFSKLIDPETDSDAAFEKQVRTDGIEHASSRIAKLINKKIHSYEVALQFILEELDAARDGNDMAVEFALNSGLSPYEYIGALEKTIWEGEESELEHVQLYLRHFGAKIRDIDLRVELGINIIDKIMQKWEIGKYIICKDNISKTESTLTIDELSDDQKLYNLALKYQKINSLEKALDLFIQAADMGNDRAQYQLGFMYSKGIGVKCDYEKAIEYFGLAAEQGHVYAYGSLSYHFLNGLGCIRDEEKCIEYLIKAAEGGDIGSQCNLGGLYLDNKLSYLETDVNKAIKWLELAASNNEHPASFDAQFKLGSICYLFSCDGLKASEVIKAKEWYTLAAQNGHEGAKNALESFFKINLN